MKPCQQEGCQNEAPWGGPFCLDHGCCLCGKKPEQPPDTWPVFICFRCRDDICSSILSYEALAHRLRLLLNQAYENGRRSVLGTLDPEDER